jgi:uncharacterized protein YdaU (DUF1376 family)
LTPRKRKTAGPLPFYKAYPANFLSGCMSLAAEQKGVYYTLLNLLYDRWETIDDSTLERRQYLARVAGISTKGFGIIRDQLIAEGKLHRAPDGTLSNARFDRELARMSDSSDQVQDIITANNSLKNVPKNLHATNENKGLSASSRARVLETRSQNLDSTSAGTGLSDETERHLESEISQICRAIGVDLQADTRRITWPQQWLRMKDSAGVELVDILEAIKGFQNIKPDQVRSLALFKDRAIERRQARVLHDKLAAHRVAREVSDVSTVTDDRWHEALALFLSIGAWDPRLGPSPPHPGCLAPTAMLDRAEKFWIKQGNHPDGMHVGGTRDPWLPNKAPSHLPQHVQPFAPREK